MVIPLDLAKPVLLIGHAIFNETEGLVQRNESLWIELWGDVGTYAQILYCWSDSMPKVFRLYKIVYVSAISLFQQRSVNNIVYWDIVCGVAIAYSCNL